MGLDGRTAGGTRSSRRIRLLPLRKGGARGLAISFRVEKILGAFTSAVNVRDAGRFRFVERPFIDV